MSHKRVAADERKKQIALVAASLFAKKGFNGVTTREIAKKAKVNEAIIFRFFPNKEKLYTEIINQKVKIAPEMFNFDAVKSGNDEDLFKSVAANMLKQIKEDNTFLRIMLYSALEGHDLSDAFLRSRNRVLFDFLDGYISKRKGEGIFQDIDSRIPIRAFIGMFVHFSIVRELFNVPDFLYVSDEDAINHFVNIFLNGLKR
jgi:AcrR family transcriptional regulator